MFITKLIYFLLSFSATRERFPYHKMIIYKGVSGCVEATTTKKLAQWFNAEPGICSREKCPIFKGDYILAFCCKVSGYECQED